MEFLVFTIISSPQIVFSRSTLLFSFWRGRKPGLCLGGGRERQPPAGGGEGFADVGGPGLLIESVINAQEVWIRLARVDDLPTLQGLPHVGLVAPTRYGYFF